MRSQNLSELQDMSIYYNWIEFECLIGLDGFQIENFYHNCIGCKFFKIGRIGIDAHFSRQYGHPAT